MKPLSIQTKIKLVVGLLLLSLFTVFAVQNSEVVTVRFLAWELSMSQVVVLLVPLVVGITLGWIAHAIVRLRRKKV